MQDLLTTPTWLSWCRTRRPPLLCTMCTSKITVRSFAQCAPVRSELWPLALAADNFRIWSVWPQPIICLFLIHKRSSTATSHSQFVMHDQQNDCIFVWNILRDSQILNMIVIHVWMTMYIWESPRRSFQSAWYQCLPLTIKTCSKKVKQVFQHLL